MILPEVFLILLLIGPPLLLGILAVVVKRLLVGPPEDDERAPEPDSPPRGLGRNLGAAFVRVALTASLTGLAIGVLQPFVPYGFVLAAGALIVARWIFQAGRESAQVVTDRR